ncbi:MAG: hypothetical protein AB1728_15760 [Bacteroidota bacterium]
MTLNEIRQLNEKRFTGTITEEEMRMLDGEIGKLAVRPVDSLSREEEILFWMYGKNCSYDDAERWVAVQHGEYKPGKQNDGSYLD